MLLQFAFGLLVFPQLGLLHASYLVWAGLLLILGRKLADTIGLACLADVLATAISLGALLSAVIALTQWLGLAERIPWMLSEPGPVFANVGQKNHYAHYSWLGIASAFYLRGRLQLSRNLLWVLILTIGFASALSGSRSVFLYLLAIFAALAWARRKDPSGPTASLVVDAGLFLPILVALNLAGTWASPRIPELWAWLGNISPALDLGSNSARGGSAVMPSVLLYKLASVPSDRLAIARAAWSAFLDRPWLGQGVGNFSWASFEAATRRYDDEYFEIAEHAHNYVFQLLVDFGGPAVAAVILLLAFWVRQFIRQTWRLEHFWCASILCIGAVHSMLEYPLWFSYFLGPTALLLGATDSRKTIELTGRRITIYLVLVTLAGSLILGNLRSDYRKIREASYYPLRAHLDQDRARQISMNHLLELHSESLLSPWALLVFTYWTEPNRVLAQDRADLCERGIRFSPSRLFVTRCAMQLAIAGRDADAGKLASATLRAFPADRAEIVGDLAKGAKMFPEIEPLWVLSQQR
jgi:O-antigen ligase